MKKSLSLFALCTLALMAFGTLAATAQTPGSARIKAQASGRLQENPNVFVQAGALFNGYSDYGFATVVDLQTRDYLYISCSTPVVTEDGFVVAGLCQRGGRWGWMEFKGSAADNSISVSFNGVVLVSGHLDSIMVAP